MEICWLSVRDHKAFLYSYDPHLSLAVSWQSVPPPLNTVLVANDHPSVENHATSSTNSPPLPRPLVLYCLDTPPREKKNVSLTLAGIWIKHVSECSSFSIKWVRITM